MTKTDYVKTMATLLSLDKVDERELNKLSIDILAKMYNNYIRNAREANHKLERVHEAAFKQLTATSRYRNIHSA